MGAMKESMPLAVAPVAAKLAPCPKFEATDCKYGLKNGNPIVISSKYNGYTLVEETPWV
jgi:hypothetical protein